MKLAFVTDQHWDLHSRFEETKRVHAWIADDAAERGCTGTLLGGDLFERKSVADERNACGDWLIRMAQFGPVIGVYGNHCAIGDLDLFNLLEAPHPIRFHATPTVELLAGGPGGSVAVACIPWPRKTNLLAQLGPVSMEAGSNAAQECLRNIFRGLAFAMDDRDDGDTARLALAHILIDGATTDHDQPLVGLDMAVSLADLSLLRADFYACGHIHAQNTFRIDAAPCIYGGSPRHCNYGEPGPKGYVVVEFDGPRLVGWERVPTPCTPMVLLEARWQDGAFTGGDRLVAAERAGSDVRFRFRVRSDERDAARAAAQRVRTELLELGAVAVKLEEEVEPTTRARAPEIAAATTLSDKLTCLWTSRGDDLPEARRARLLGKAAELEQEASNV